MREFIVFTLLIFIISIFCVGISNAGYIRLSDGSLVGEGDNIQQLDKVDLNDVYRVQNTQADVVTAKNKYGQEIIVIDGRINSIGR